MRRVLKWTVVVVAGLAVTAFLVFLYVMPPFFITPPEAFGAEMARVAPPVDHIADPAQRAVAERGRTIVMTTGCIGCHAANGPTGPDYSRYLAGGGTRIVSRQGSYVSRNLTPDPDTGLARRTDDEVKRVLRSGTFPDGHVAPYTTMPWANFSHWSEEDRYAVLVYLRSLPPVRHQIPEPTLEPVTLPAGAVEGVFGLKDYGIN